MEHKLLHFDFYSHKDSNCTREQAVELLKTTSKPIVYTHGFEYRGPTTHRVPITREKALEYAKDAYLEVTEEKDVVHVNTFSENDMW